MIIIRGSSTRHRASLCHRCRLHLQIGAVGGGRERERERGCRLPHSLSHIVFLAATCRNIDLLPPASASNWSTRPPSRTATGSCARHMRHAAPTSATTTTTATSTTNEGSSLAGGGRRLAASCDPHLSRSTVEFAFFKVMWSRCSDDKDDVDL